MHESGLLRIPGADDSIAHLVALAADGLDDDEFEDFDEDDEFDVGDAADRPRAWADGTNGRSAGTGRQIDAWAYDN